MDKTKSVYVKLLIAAIVLYVIGTTFMICDLQYRVGEMEHALAHIPNSGYGH